MDHLNSIEHLTTSLKANLEALDLLGFAAAAGYIELAINAIDMRKNKTVNNILLEINLNKYESVLFFDMDLLIEEIFN